MQSVDFSLSAIIAESSQVQGKACRSDRKAETEAAAGAEGFVSAKQRKWKA